MKRVFIILLLAFGLANGASAQRNLSIGTRILLNDVQKLEKQGHKLSLNDTAFINRHALLVKDNAVYANCFLLLGEDFDKAAFEKLGCRINTLTGKIATAIIPIDCLMPASEIGGIRKIEVGTKVEPVLDSARSATSVNEVNEGSNGLLQAYKGDGVVVGVIDIGFEYGHATFWNEDHTQYRVKRVWNQRYDYGTPPSGFNYGHELNTQSAILNAQHDGTNHYHGTHVAGIAGGSGGEANAIYRGVAPNSDLVFVVTAQTRPSFIDAINYIKDYAASVGKPCVINISFGGHSEAHDGTSFFEQACDQLVGAGTLVTISAGNAGADPIYASKTAVGVDTMSVACLLDQSSSSYDYAYANIWGEVGNPFAVALYLYDTITHTYVDSTNYASTSSNDSFYDYLYYGGTSYDITLYTDAADQGNNRPAAAAVIENANSSSGRYYPVIKVRTTATNGTTTQMWGLYDLSFASNIHSSMTNGSTSSTINSLATGYNSISVGAFTSRKSWTALNGSPHSYSSAVVGDIASFSSKGPSADGRIKPTIAAPGHAIVSSYSRFSSEAYYSPTSIMAVYSQTIGGTPYYYGVMSGTSMSSPFAAGVIALWLQQKPDLTPQQVINLLQNTATIDQYTTSPIPNNVWGYGKINALSSMLQLEAGIEPTFGEVTTDSIVEQDNGLMIYATIVNHGDPIAAEVGFDFTSSNSTHTTYPVAFTETTIQYSYLFTDLENAAVHSFKAYILNDNGSINYGNTLTYATDGLIDVNDKAIAVNLYPNPSSKDVVLELSGLKSEANLFLIDMQGRQTLLQTLKPNQQKATIDLRNHPSAMYYIKIQSKEAVIMKKLIKN
jgi:subtilisin family serine protease